MSSEKQSSGAPAGLLIVIGLVLMLVGAYIAYNVKIPFQESLAHQGVPLDIGKTISILGVFLILFPVIKFFFVTPLQTAIQERTQSLEATFAEAESLRKEMQSMRSDYEQRLVATEANAREQIQSQIREAQNLRARLEAEAGQRADDMLARAQQEIEAEKQKALAEIRMKVVDLTMIATERVLGENMDNDRNRRLVNEFIDKVEVPA